MSAIVLAHHAEWTSGLIYAAPVLLLAILFFLGGRRDRRKRRLEQETHQRGRSPG